MKYFLYTMAIVCAIFAILITLESAFGWVAVILAFAAIIAGGIAIYKDITKDKCNIRGQKE